MDAHATLLITKINQHVNKDWVENKLLKAVALSLNSVECRRTINKAINKFFEKERNQASVNEFIHLLETIYSYKLNLNEFLNIEFDSCGG